MIFPGIFPGSFQRFCMGLGLITVIAGSVIAGSALADEVESPGPWVDVESHRVSFAPQPRLEVILSELQAQEDYWGRLDLRLGYDAKLTAQQKSELQKTYPSYRIEAVRLGKAGNYHVSIPALAISTDEETRWDDHGPWLNTFYFLSKSQYEKLKLVFDQPDFVRVDGSLFASVDRLRVVERLDLDDSLCEVLSPPFTSVDRLLRQGIPQARQRSEAVKIRYPETLTRLKSELVAQCLEFDSAPPLRSFQDLFAHSFMRKNKGIHVVTERKAMGDDRIALRYFEEKRIRER